MTKNKVKKTKISTISLKKIPEQEKDYLAAILEEMRSDFRAFGESLEFVREKGDATFEEVGRIKVEIEEIKDTQTLMREDIKIIKQDVEVLKHDVGALKQDVKRIDGRLDNIEQEVSAIRSEINFWKANLTQRADTDVLKTLEARLVRVEHHLKLA